MTWAPGMPATLVRRPEGRDHERQIQNHSRAGKANAQLRAFQRRVTIEPVDRNRWQVKLDGASTELVVMCLRENQWAVSKTSGEIVARNCRSATEAERVAVHHLYLYGSPPQIEP
jgi:hypothetical protein